MNKTLKINCDIGECLSSNPDEDLMPLVDIANIACGGHAGNDSSIKKTIKLAVRNKVSIGEHPSYLDKKNFGYFFLITIASIMLTTGLLTSVTYINVSLTIIIFCTYPIVVLAISIFITKEKIKNIIKFLFLTTFIGLFLALSPSTEDLKIQGIIFALIASLGASIMIVTNQTMSKKNISPIQINIFINFFNTIFFFIILSLFYKIDTDVSLNAFLILLIPSCSYAIALFLQLLAIPRIGQTNTALFLYLEPITGIFGAVLILNEKLTSIQLLGTAIVLISLAASTFVTRKN